MKRSRSPDYDGDDPKRPKRSLDDPNDVVARFLEPDAKTCPHCWQRFAEKSSLREHISNAHQSSRRFECDRCPSSYSGKIALARHVSEKHVKARRLACGSCGFSTSRRAALEEHVLRMHGNPLKCPQCGRVCDTDDELQAHIQSKHVVNKNYVCPDCGSRYSTKGNLDRHRRNSRQCHSRRR